MKILSFISLFLLVGISLFGQAATVNTNTVGSWKVSNTQSCTATPTYPAGLTTPNTPVLTTCGGALSATGFGKITPTTTNNGGLCDAADNETRFFRRIYNHNSTLEDNEPCWFEYNITADNAVRIYLNGISAPSNVLNPPANSASASFCGGQYTGADLTQAFSGKFGLNFGPNGTNVFNSGSNNVDFEVQNASRTDSEYNGFWFSGQYRIRTFGNLNANFNFPVPKLNADGLGYTVTIKPTSPVAEGVTLHCVVEVSQTNPGVVWNTIFDQTASTFAEIKAMMDNPPGLIAKGVCDDDGIHIRATLTAVGGDCSKTVTWEWGNNCSTLGNGSVSMMKMVDDKGITHTINPNIAENIAEQTFQTVKTGAETATISPNPSTGIIHVGLPTSEHGMSNVQVFNEIGALVQEGKGMDELQLDLSNLPNGVYFIKVSNEAREPISNHKVILQK